MKRKITERLINWKKSSSRMPLILNGARQVGKTYILKEFGRENYANVIYVNLETQLKVASYFEDDIDPVRIIRYLEIMADEKITPGDTLIIFDEIQSCERALTSLKYFYELVPEYHIVAAGSLLGVAINRNQYSYPVGKVDTVNLYPMDFEEFLWANSGIQLALEIKKSYTEDMPLPDVLHLKALDLFRHYLIIGGMPAVIKAYQDTHSLVDIASVQSRIVNDYIADMAKYATNSESVKIRAAFNSIPNQLAKDNKKFQYKLAQKGGTAIIFGAAIEWLNFAGIVLKCQKVDHAMMPISVYSDLSSFKLYMGDVGLLTMKSGISHQTVLSHLETNTSFIGSICENYVAQSLASNHHPLYYWTSKDTAEVDFLLQLGENIIPIEVKAGVHTRTRSLNVYRELYTPPFVIKVSSKNFGFENGIKSVPLYAVFCI